MKKHFKTCIVLLLSALAAFSLIGCPEPEVKNDGGNGDAAALNRVRFTGAENSTTAINAVLGTPASSSDSASLKAGSIAIKVTADELVVQKPKFETRPADVSVQYAVNKAENFGGVPVSLANNDTLWVKASKDGGTLYYKINVSVGKTSGGGDFPKGDGRGVPDPEWAAKYPYMIFPNLEQDELLTDSINLTTGIPTKLPPPSYWNGQTTAHGMTGHIHAYPDPFHFANGNRVTSMADWENRRKELQVLVSYYGKGYIPSIDPRVVDIWLTGAENRTINIRHKASGRTANFTISVTNNAALTVAGNEGKLYASSGGASLASTANMTLTTGNHQSSITAANITTLYGITAGLMTRDSATAWCASVLLAAIEGTDDPTTATGSKQDKKQYFYAISEVGSPTPGLEDQSWFTTKGPLYSSGYSTGGKQAAAHVMGIGRNGARFGFADIGDSGAGGAAIERFNAVAGFRSDITLGETLSYSGYSEADVRALGLDPELKNPIKNTAGKAYGWPVPIAPLNHIGAAPQQAGALGGYSDLWGTPYYMYGLQSGRTWNVDIDGTSVNIAGTGTANARVVRGWAPYWEAFDQYPNVNANFGNANGPSSTYLSGPVPYVAYQFDGYGGIQQYMQGRGEDKYNNANPPRAWFGDVWYDFNDLHNGLDLDHARSGGSGRGVEGFGCSMPFETYFITILNAPYGTNYIRAGLMQTRTNQPSMWANWLIVDEVYKFYGEQEYAEEFSNGSLVEDSNYPGTGLKMGWDKYLWRNLNFFNWGSHGGTTTEETSTSTTVAGIIRSGKANSDTAKATVALAKCRDPMFPVDDPVYYLAEWHKFDWGRPGSPTIAERVKRRVEPILKDYFMGEMYHTVPASNTNSATAASTYHNAAKEAYTPTGPKFKRMDWKGLTDSPEIE